MLLNNFDEIFNAWIKEVKSKPILTMVEDICRQIMACSSNKKGIESNRPNAQYAPRMKRSWRSQKVIQ
jgi:hypothetical protein